MDELDKQNKTARSQPNLLESLCQEFNGISFYGLEYVVEDLFQTRTAKKANLPYTVVDWFGLND